MEMLKIGMFPIIPHQSKYCLQCWR